jgi:glyoxylase-like metal-dependent hydrolase (beta-lactamase superfamily II)
MYPTRMALRVKQHLMSSPQYLVRHALINWQSISYHGTTLFNDKLCHVVSLLGINQPIQVLIDNATHLPCKTEAWEDDPVYGDVLFEVVFDEWSHNSVFVTPKSLRYVYNGMVTNQENLSRTEFDIPLSSLDFIVAFWLHLPFELDQYHWGEVSSQWFGRMLAMGVPFDLDQGHPDHVLLWEFRPWLALVMGGSHNSLIIEFDTFLVVVEPALYERRTEGVLAKAAERWPGKPVKYIVATHYHHDHIGSLRGYVAQGAMVVIGAGAETLVNNILTALHTVVPDSLAKNPVEAEIISVAEKAVFDISDGVRTIQIHQIPNEHSTTALIAYIPEAKLIFTSDLYGPGNPVPYMPPQNVWAIDFRDWVLGSNLDVEWIAGGHGAIHTLQRMLYNVNISEQLFPR